MLKPTVNIKAINTKLTDGSLVTDVYVRQDQMVFVFPAMTDKDAEQFAVGLRDLIEKHTLELVSVE